MSRRGGPGELVSTPTSTPLRWVWLGLCDHARYSVTPQVLCLTEAILFTERCEEAMATGQMNELLFELESQLDTYTNTSIDQVYMY